MIEYTVKVYLNCYKEWYLNGRLHREDGPAIEFPNGSKEWYLNGKRHREDGPAMEFPNGDKFWYLNGKLHRECGAAIEWDSGDKNWWLNGEEVTEEEHRRRTSKTKELTVQEISDLLGYEVKVVK